MFWGIFWPKHVGENVVNKIHHRMLKCILLVIYIFLDLINAWMMEHFLISYSLLTLHILNAVLKTPIIFPYFPEMCIPVLTNIFLWFYFWLPAFSHNMTLKSWKVLPV